MIAGMRAATRQTARAGYAVMLRTIYSRRGMPWRLYDETIRIDPRVRHLLPHEPEPALYRFIAATVRPGDVILDIGAFLGGYAILEARRAGPSGRVVALEPTPASASIARRHVAFNSGGIAPITLIEAAAGAASGTAELFEYDLPYVNALGRAVDVQGPARMRTVDVVTVDRLCSELRIVPTFIRMDVQGAELDVLRGARSILRASGGTLTIVAEMHPQCWPSYGIDARTVPSILAELGLRAEPLVPGSDPFARDAHAVLVRVEA